MALVCSYRYDKEMVDLDVVKLEAAKLHEAISKKQLDHDDVVWILSTRNVFQLQATFEFYKQNYGNSIDQVWIVERFNRYQLSGSFFFFFLLGVH